MGDAFGEEGAGEADVFTVDGLVAAEGGFAAGEADEAVAAEIELEQVLDGEAVWAAEGEGGLLGVAEAVEGVAVEVEDLVGLVDGLFDGGLVGLAGGEGGDAVAWGQELVDEGGFGFGVVEGG